MTEHHAVQTQKTDDDDDDDDDNCDDDDDDVDDRGGGGDDDDDDDDNNNNNKLNKFCKQQLANTYELWIRKVRKNVLKKVRVRSTKYIGSTFEKDIKKLVPRKTCKYLGIKESHDVEHKNEKEKLKNEYLGGGAEISFGYRIKCKE